jgi:hypothetical protein
MTDKKGIRNTSERLHEQACLYQITHDEKDYTEACFQVLKENPDLRESYEEQNERSSSGDISDVSQRLTAAAKEIMRTSAVSDFAKACKMALEEDTALAREYAESGDKRLKVLVNHQTKTILRKYETRARF